MQKVIIAKNRKKMSGSPLGKRAKEPGDLGILAMPSLDCEL